MKVFQHSPLAGGSAVGAEIEQELERQRYDALYFEDRRQELMVQYPDHWIAVYNEAVVATAKRLPQLIRKLDKLGVPCGKVFVEDLSTKDDILILSRRKPHCLTRIANRPFGACNFPREVGRQRIRLMTSQTTVAINRSRTASLPGSEWHLA
jgi:hypothetical protein